MATARVISTRPTFGPAFPKVIAGVAVAVIIGAGAWVVGFGLPTGEAANWWVLIGALVLLTAALVAWRHVDPSKVGLLQRCLIVSVLLHVLLAAGFSAVVVARQVVRVLSHEEVLMPTVNLNLSREVEVREQVRRQASAELPVPTPVPSLLQRDTESPLPAVSDRVNPVGIPGLPQMQISAQRAPVAPTIPLAPPAPQLVTPLLPVQPTIDPLPQMTTDPSVVADTAKQWEHLPGPMPTQLAARATSPVPGLGVGTLGAPPSMLMQGTSTGGTATGSGTGRALSLLASAAPPRTLDLPVPTAALPRPSMPDVMIPRGAAGFDTLGQRGFEQREKMLQKYGGSSETEAAVALGLLYLSRVQRWDGHWTKIEADGTNKGNDEHDVGLTGLAVLSYLAANHTPANEGPYRDVVRKGVDYLVSIEKVDGDMRGQGNMYDHAIGTLALGEAAAMTGDKRLREAAHRAAQFCLDAQNGAGAWRYKPGDWFTDTSVTGWQIMAMHSAERTGFKVNDDAKSRVFGFLGTVSKGREGVLSGYLTAVPTLTMTAEGVFTRMLLGQKISDEALAEAAGFLQNPKSDGFDYYYVYYGSLAMMQMQGAAWKRWNGTTASLLVGMQEKKGADAGSYPVIGEWGERGGKVYTTTLSTLSLEVYYRYLPMYGK